jgi:hypothetical protein
LYVQIVVAGASVTPGTPGTGTVTVTVLPSATPTYGPVGCYNSALVSQTTVPDLTKIKAGDSFTQTWVVKNTGTCEWSYDYKLAFISNPLGSDTFKIRRTVSPNATTDLSVDLIAPTAPGTYTSIWRLVTDDGQGFGVSFSVTVSITGATFTPTPTPTITPTVTATKIPALTNTRTPSKTPAPSVTPTPTENLEPTVTPTGTPTQ